MCRAKLSLMTQVKAAEKDRWNIEAEMASFFYKQEAGREHSGKVGWVLVLKGRLIQQIVTFIPWVGTRTLLYFETIGITLLQFSLFQSLSHVRLFATMDCSTPGFPVLHYPPDFAQIMSIESVMPSNYLILYCPLSSCPQSFPASGSFQMSQLFASSGQSIGVSASTSVLPVNIQDWFPLGGTGWISLQSKGLSRVFLLGR